MEFSLNQPPGQFSLGQETTWMLQMEFTKSSDGLHPNK